MHKTAPSASRGAAAHSAQCDIDGRRNTVRLDRPHIPAWLEHVELEDLAVGNGRVSLRVSRDTNGAAAVTVIDNSANADIEAV